MGAFQETPGVAVVAVVGSTNATAGALACATLGGRYSGPVWPQPARFSTPARAMPMPSRLFFVFNMVKL